MKALVVDDSRAMRMILGRILKGEGFEVTDAEHGKAALDIITAHPAGTFGLVMVDWNMPVMNGLELVQAVRAIRIHDATKIMMVTTETEHDNVVRALEAGASEYLMKPFTPEALREKLVILGMSVAA